MCKAVNDDFEKMYSLGGSTINIVAYSLFSECLLQVSFHRGRHHPRCCLVYTFSPSDAFMHRLQLITCHLLCLKLHFLGGATVNNVACSYNYSAF